MPRQSANYVFRDTSLEDEGDLGTAQDAPFTTAAFTGADSPRRQGGCGDGATRPPRGRGGAVVVMRLDDGPVEAASSSSGPLFLDNKALQESQQAQLELTSNQQLLESQPSIVSGMTSEELLRLHRVSLARFVDGALSPESATSPQSLHRRVPHPPALFSIIHSEADEVNALDSNLNGQVRDHGDGSPNPPYERTSGITLSRRHCLSESEYRSRVSSSFHDELATFRFGDPSEQDAVEVHTTPHARSRHSAL